MNVPHVLYHMVRADFLERVRRYSFLVTLAAALYLAYGVGTEKIWIKVGNNYRGVYNSAWIGMLMCATCSTYLSLAGFYIVKNSIQRDADTRVGRILAATPMRKDFYTFAKTLSNFAVLACMVAVLMLAAVVMQLMRAEAHSFSLWKLWARFIFLALPAMLVTASVAVLFETLPGLRGGFGNVVYFFAWTAALALGITGFDDPVGLQLFYSSTRRALDAIDPQTGPNFNFSLTIGGQRAVHTFLWNGIDWTAHMLFLRVLWIAVAAALALTASLFFHRFDPARIWRSPSRKKGVALDAPQPSRDDQPSAVAFLNPPSAALLTPLIMTPLARTNLVRTSPRSRFAQLLTSEVRLMLKGQRWWWYTVAAGLLIAQFASPRADVRGGILVAAWIWPILIWSQMGCRETRFNTESLLFSCERSLGRQLPALWAAGVVVALLTGGGVGIRLLLAHNMHGFTAWFAGACFIPSFALACGIWSGSSKMFEAIYTAWWYIGPAHQTHGLDFMGTSPASSTPGIYAVATVLLVAVAYYGRRVRLGYV
jgi:hypothetical protein